MLGGGVGSGPEGGTIGGLPWGGITSGEVFAGSGLLSAIGALITVGEIVAGKAEDVTVGVELRGMTTGAALETEGEDATEEPPPRKDPAREEKVPKEAPPPPLAGEREESVEGAAPLPKSVCAAAGGE